MRISDNLFTKLENLYVIISIGVLFALSVYSGMYLSIVVIKLINVQVDLVRKDVFDLLLSLFYFFLSMLNLHFSPDVFDYLHDRRKQKRMKDDY